jgi:hypothetical protein
LHQIKCNMLKKYFLLVFLMILAINQLDAGTPLKPMGVNLTLHPFHISMTEIKYNAAKKSLEISEKIFWDDLEVELNEYSKSKINFLKPANKEELNKLVGRYILEHTDIYINEKKIALNYLGYEIEEDVAWIYIEAVNIPAPKTAEIKNSILFKNFPAQQNIINFYRDKTPKSLRLIESQTEGKINF